MRIAITRKVSPGIGNCELTHLARVPIDLALAEQQHLAYERCLESLGCEVHSLPCELALPDSVFVEDAAIVLPEMAIITRPGASSRRAETAGIAAALRPYRELAFIEAPATVDGGDVLRVGKRVLVGLSARTNAEGLEQLRAWLAPHGYDVTGVHLAGCLHLKSAASQVADSTLLINPSWVNADDFRAFTSIEVATTEPFAANALRIGQALVYPSAFPETRRRLERQGIELAIVDVSELGKAEGGVTCCALILENED
jgi:dimethylargininase